MQEALAPKKLELDQAGSEYEKFIIVCSRWNQALPKCVEGNVKGLADRLVACWNEHGNKTDARFETYRSILRGAGMVIEGYFPEDKTPLVGRDAMVSGTLFYELPAVDTVRLNSQHANLVGVRSEIYSILVWITIIFAGTTLPPHDWGFPPTPYIPFRKAPMSSSKLQNYSPNHRNLYELAATALYFRHMCSEEKQGYHNFHPPFVRCTDPQLLFKGGAHTASTVPVNTEPAQTSSSAPSGDAAVPPEVPGDFTKEWFHRLSGERDQESDTPQQSALAFAASRLLEFRSIGLEVSPLSCNFWCIFLR